MCLAARLFVKPRVHLALLIAVSLVALAPSATMAQSGSRVDAAPAVAPVPTDAPSSEPASDRWLLKSPLVNVGWPEFKLPWNRGDQPSTGEATSPLMQPIERVRTTMQGAMQRTRTAWNNALDRVRWRRDDTDGLGGSLNTLEQSAAPRVASAPETPAPNGSATR